MNRTLWKNRVLSLALSFVLVGSFYATTAWFNIRTFSKSSIVSPQTIGSETVVATGCSDNYHHDAKIAAHLHRARLYAESRKENQNATVTVVESGQFGRGTTSRIIACYYTIPRDLNSSRELTPSHIDPHICTHVIVGFASVVNCTISLGGASRIFKSIEQLKNHEPKLKVMVSVGGMYELQDGFPQMVKTHANRKRFIKSVINVTRTLNLDGLDIDWEFPAWRGADDRQRIYFVQLLQELRRKFDRSHRKLLLSVAVAAPVPIVDRSYNVAEIAEHVDFVCLMAYDYHYYVWYFPITGHNAPLYPRSTENGYDRTLNVNYSAMYWLAKEMPREKLVIGIPTYGHSYELDNPLNHDLSAPAKGFGKLGIDGFVSYTDVCWFLENGATRHFDENSTVPYAYKHNEWMSYEDTISVRQKGVLLYNKGFFKVDGRIRYVFHVGDFESYLERRKFLFGAVSFGHSAAKRLACLEKDAKWIKANGFGGAMIFSLNDDDWNSNCVGTKTNETFPLTRVIVRTLRDTWSDTSLRYFPN